MLPPHIITALQKWALAAKEKMASPLDHDPNTGVNTQDIRSLRQNAPSPTSPSSMVFSPAIPFNMKTPSTSQQKISFTLLPLAQR